MKKKILVTGASSFLGHHVMPLLNISPKFEILAPTSKELNLLDRDQVINYICNNKPDIILHMAALCGGIGANKAAPAEFAHDNLKMSVNLFDGIRKINKWGREYEKQAEQPVVTHFYGLGTICSYPKNCPVPFKEEDMWNGFPEETNAPYGNAKRMMYVLQQSFRQQYGLKGAHLTPVNLFGEWDHFNLDSSHVMPALISKFITAKVNGDEFVEVWGDGTPTREFLYAGDCARAIVKAIIEDFDYSDPINIGTGIDISIKDLADLIKEVVHYEGRIKFTGDVSVNGQPKRRLDVSRARDVLGFTARTDLRTGLEKTVAWYKKSASKQMREMEYEEISKLTRAISLLEKNADEVFDCISLNLQDNRIEVILNNYISLLNLALERAQALKNVKINKDRGIFIKAKSVEKEITTPDLQNLVSNIRNSIGEPELLKRIANHIDSIKPNFDTITKENKEFLHGLISRAQQASTSNVPGIIDFHSKMPLNQENKIINSVDFFERAGLGRNFIQDRQKKRSEELKAIGVENTLQQDLGKIAEQINAIKDDSEIPKYNKVKRLDSYGTNVEFDKKLDVPDALKGISESTEKARDIFNRKTQNIPSHLFNDDVNTKVINNDKKHFNPLESDDKPERDFSFYENADIFKREKANSAIIGEGPGSFRRTGNHQKVKSLSDYETDFTIAAEKFAKEHGIPVSDLIRNKRGKRFSNGLGRVGITDTEVMLSNMKLPSVVKQTDPNKISSNKPKVEKIKKQTLISSTKKFVSSIFKSIKW